MSQSTQLTLWGITYHLNILFQNFPTESSFRGGGSGTNTSGGCPATNPTWVCTPRHRSDNSHSATKTVAILLVGDFDSALFRFKHSNKEQTHPRAEPAPLLFLVSLRKGSFLRTQEAGSWGVPSLPHPVLAHGKGCI